MKNAFLAILICAVVVLSILLYRKPGQVLVPPMQEQKTLSENQVIKTAEIGSLRVLVVDCTIKRDGVEAMPCFSISAVNKQVSNSVQYIGTGNVYSIGTDTISIGSPLGIDTIWKYNAESQKFETADFDHGYCC